MVGCSVPESAFKLCSLLWTTSRSFSCTKNKEIGLSSQIQCLITLDPVFRKKKKKKDHLDVVGSDVAIHGDCIFSTERNYVLRKSKRLNFLAMFY